MKIHNYRPIGKGLMIASCDIEIEEWGLTIRNCTLFDKGGNKWISFPSKKTDGPDGKPKYFSYVTMDKEKKERFDKTAIALLDAEAYKAQSGGPDVAPADVEVPW